MLRAAIAAALGGVLLLAGVLHAADLSPNEQARATLDRVLPAGVLIDFKAVPLKDALEFVRDVTAANIHVNWKALGAADVLPETAVSVHLRGVPLRKVLNTILSEAAGEKLAWYVSDGMFEITTKELADAVVFVRVYAIEDLLVEPPQNESNMMLPMTGAMGMNGGYNDWGGGRNMRGGGYGMGRRGGSGQGMNNYGMNGYGPGMNSYMPGMNSWNMPGANTNANRTNADNTDETAKKLIEAIKTTVYPAYWEDGKASIKFFKGKVIVRAPRCVHEMLAGPVE